MRELTVLVDCLYFVGTYDQLNLGSLSCLNVIRRRIQQYVEAYHNPDRADWGGTNFFTSVDDPYDVVDPTFRQHAVRGARERETLGGISKKALGPAEGIDDADNIGGSGGNRARGKTRARGRGVLPARS